MKLLLVLSISTIVFIGISGMRCQKQDSSTDESQLISELAQFANSVAFPSDIMLQHINTIASSPHPMGSPRQREVFLYLKAEAEALGFRTATDSFTASVPNPDAMGDDAGPANLVLEKPGRNLFASTGQNKDCVILFASHYDSKFFSSFVYRGANDSASSSAALLWLLTAVKEYAKQELLRCDFAAIWFDGEESYLENWNDGVLRHPAKIQDNTYGSRHVAANMVACEGAPADQRHCLPENLGGQKLEALILLDMIGSPNVSLSRDSNSDPSLRETAKNMAHALDMKNIYSRSFPRAIVDDHIPFKDIGIAVINFIDFENLSVWHQPGDDPELVNIRSVELVSRLALGVALKTNIATAK
ncbi:MAG: M28 family peptidase [Oligoflexus sp.]